jgi:hypothetical protein
MKQGFIGKFILVSNPFHLIPYMSQSNLPTFLHCQICPFEIYFRLCQFYTRTLMWYTYTSIIGSIALIYDASLRIAFEYIQMSQNNFIEKVADRITDLGLVGPAILLLEANRPLAFIGSQLLLVAQPTLDIFLPQNFTQNTINLLSDSDQLEQLITILETKTLPRQASDGSQPKISQHHLQDNPLASEEVKL